MGQPRTLDEDGEPLRHPSDPRNLPCYRARGPKRWGFTYADLAACAGVSVAAAKKAAHRRRLDPRDLASVVAWVDAHRERSERRQLKDQKRTMAHRVQSGRTP